ncbi:hypothetical protein GBF38_017874 [Nibea albiflora]|uniref:Uncharacterized protein n=1 Tax=Nibea albiflora TaxID=240163 RepID=A0ACB7F687_NIBAL|nr:hypothetical protein GBF38_017874 [Nibea albiflora]
MALKQIQRLPLLGQFGIQRYPHVGATRLLSASTPAQPVCVACLCTSAGGCIRTRGCRKLQQYCGRRSLTTIIKEPSFVASSSVGLHRESGLRFRLTQLHRPTTAEEEDFNQRLRSCSSSRQVFTLLRSVEMVSDTMAAAVLHRCGRPGGGRKLSEGSYSAGEGVHQSAVLPAGAGL